MEQIRKKKIQNIVQIESLSKILLIIFYFYEKFIYKESFFKKFKFTKKQSILISFCVLFVLIKNYLEKFDIEYVYIDNLSILLIDFFI